MSLAVIGLAQALPLGLQAEGVAVEDAPTAWLSGSTRLATTSGIVPGLSAAASSSLRSWRTVSSSSCFSFLSSALVLSMTVVEPLSAASALSAPVRWRDVLGRDVGGGRPVGEAGAGRHRRQQAGHRRQERVGLLLGRRRACRPCRLAGLPALAASAASARAGGDGDGADRQAGNQDADVVESKLACPEPTSRAVAGPPCQRSGLVDGARRVVTERPRMNRFAPVVSVAALALLLIGRASPASRARASRCEQDSDCSDGLHRASTPRRWMRRRATARTRRRRRSPAPVGRPAAGGEAGTAAATAAAAPARHRRRGGTGGARAAPAAPVAPAVRRAATAALRRHGRRRGRRRRGGGGAAAAAGAGGAAGATADAAAD